MSHVLEVVNDTPAPEKVSVSSLAVGDGFLYGGHLYQKTNDTMVFNQTLRSENTVSAFGVDLVEPKDLSVHYKTPAA